MFYQKNHGDEYAYSLSFLIDHNDDLVVMVEEKMPQPYKSEDLYIGAYNSLLDFTTCDEASAAGYEEYLIANLASGRGYLITPSDAQDLTDDGEVTIHPLGHEWDADVEELINAYLAA